MEGDIRVSELGPESDQGVVEQHAVRVAPELKVGGLAPDELLVGPVTVGRDKGDVADDDAPGLALLDAERIELFQVGGRVSSRLHHQLLGGGIQRLARVWRS